MAVHRRKRTAHFTLLLAGFALALAGCALPRGGPDGTAGGPAATNQATDSAQAPARASSNVSADERRWAVQALQILNSVDTGVGQFHDSTAAPSGSARASVLRQQAYATLAQALGAYQQLLPETEALQDTALRDQFTFVMGNIGGFLNPTPDLPGDSPTLGDRVGRSLQNAIAVSARLRPQLQQAAGQG